MRLDELDRSLLLLLLEHPRAGLREHARTLGVARGTLAARFLRLEPLCRGRRRIRTVFACTPAIQKSPDAIATRADQNARKRRAAGDATVMLNCGNTAQFAYAEQRHFTQLG